jgi:VanZ family protein
MIYYTSNTSKILVSDPETWSNGQWKDPSASLGQLLHQESEFYDPYLNDEVQFEDLNFEFFLRKLAHILTYGMLSILIFLNLPLLKNRYITSFFLTVFVSFLDEVNQYFTYGRSGRLLDIGLDTVSAFIFLLFIFIFFQAQKKTFKD